jgi:DNA-binding NarL/FixJ family response regulator
VLQAAQTQVRTFVTAPFVAVPPGENPAEDAALVRGVRFRAVLEKATLAEPGALTEAGALAEAASSQRNGVEVRAVETLPIKLVLADADLGLVPLTVSPGAEPGAVLLHRSGLLTALDRKILTLLLAGLTDQAVAAQLGLSLRTLQRRLRQLMDQTGAESRLQLGWHAARHGWA